MKNEDKKSPQTIVLPERLVTAVDFARVSRELKMLDDWLNQASLRETGKAVTAPKTSATLEELALANKISLLEPAQRQQLMEALKAFGDQAPKIHMSFAVEPSAAFLNRMIVWLRTNVSPLILLDVGLQPTLAAGCTVRTVNKIFDMSLRNRFVESRPLLVQNIAKFQGEPQAVVTEPAQPVASADTAEPRTQTPSTSSAVTQSPAEPAPPTPQEAAK